MSGYQGFATVRNTLRHRNFRAFVFGRFYAQTAMWMYRMAVGWMVWEMTRSTTWLGIFGFLDMAPGVIVSPLAGVMADRIDRMKMLRWTQNILLCQSVLLGLLVVFDFMAIEVLAALTLAYGIITAAQQPPAHAILPSLVPPDDLPSGYGINSLLFNLARFIGPMAAGMILNIWGMGAVILTSAVGVGLFSVSLARMDVPPSVSKGGGAHRSVMRDMKDGFDYARRHEGIGPMLAILTLIGILIFPFIEMLPGIADGVFHAGSDGFALMISIIGVGAMMQAFYLAQRGPIIGLTRYITGNILVIGLGFIALMATSEFWIGLICVSVLGFAMVASRMGTMTLIQYAAEGEMRGRVASFVSVIHTACPALGALLIGVASDAFGIRTAMIGVGALTLLVWLWALYSQKKMSVGLETRPPPPS